MRKKLIRITTVPISLRVLLQGQLEFMADHYDVIAISSSGEDFRYIEKSNKRIRTHIVNMTRRITPFKDAMALLKLWYIFVKESPLIVHSHTPKAGLLGMVAAKLAGVPIRLHTVAGLPLLETSGYKRLLLNYVEKLTYTCATNVYPNSNNLAAIIRSEKLCSEHKLKVIGNGSSNGIDTAFFNRNNITEKQKEDLYLSLNMTDKNFIFCFVGRIVKSKGIEELLDAFCNVYNTHKHARLILVGNFEKELDPISGSAETLMYTHPGIKYCGYHHDVRPYLSISDTFVFPSYREGFPNVVMQAGALGVPCIVSNINGCNEIIIQDVNGILVQPKDVASLSTAMNKVVDDMLLLESMAEKCRLMITSRYDRNKFFANLLEEYECVENLHLNV